VNDFPFRPGDEPPFDPHDNPRPQSWWHTIFMWALIIALAVAFVAAARIYMDI